MLTTCPKVLGNQWLIRCTGQNASHNGHRDRGNQQDSPTRQKQFRIISFLMWAQEQQQHQISFLFALISIISTFTVTSRFCHSALAIMQKRRKHKWKQRNETMLCKWARIIICRGLPTLEVVAQLYSELVRPSLSYCCGRAVQAQMGWTAFFFTWFWLLTRPPCRKANFRGILTLLEIQYISSGCCFCMI